MEIFNSNTIRFFNLIKFYFLFKKNYRFLENSFCEVLSKAKGM